jgi:hypothetical protein
MAMTCVRHMQQWITRTTHRCSKTPNYQHKGSYKCMYRNSLLKLLKNKLFYECLESRGHAWPTQTAIQNQSSSKYKLHKKTCMSLAIIMCMPRGGADWMYAGREGNYAHAHRTVTEHHSCLASRRRHSCRMSFPYSAFKLTEIFAM